MFKFEYFFVFFYSEYKVVIINYYFGCKELCEMMDKLFDIFIGEGIILIMGLRCLLECF